MTKKQDGLTWGRFLLQFITVAAAYLIASVPSIMWLGMTSTGVLLSVVMSMGGALLVASLWLRADGVLREAWNISPVMGWPRCLIYSLLAAGIIAAWLMGGSALLQHWGYPPPDAKDILQHVTHSPLSLALWIVAVAWFAAGLGEELLWRGFLFDRLKRLPGLNAQLWLALIIQAAVFGLPHIYQGWSGVLLTGVVGLFMGWLRIKSGWSLLPCILAHALVDTVMMSLAYSEKLGWI